MQFRYTTRRNPIRDVLTGILAALVVLAALMASHPAKVDTAHANTRASAPAAGATQVNETGAN